jgi:hypothetical protein
MKIYDCFTFYNEFELLELRLAELYDYVDHFVIVEADTTFQNKRKDLLYYNNRERFKQWEDKIIYYPVTDMPVHADTWGRERHQRNSILKAVVGADDNDIIVISDIDEIPRVETIQKLRSSDAAIWGFRMPLFNFRFNYMLTNQDCYVVWSGACRKRHLQDAEDFRRTRHYLATFPYNHNASGIQIMEHAGWHFTYFGNEEFARQKIQSFAHDETNKPEILDQLNIEESIQKGTGIIQTDADYVFKPVALDDYFTERMRSSGSVIAGNFPSARTFLPH